jgi:CRP-like cAMP-binding protein
VPGSRLHTIIERYSAWCTTVLMQSVACCISHRIAHRCARLLLDAHRSTEGDDIDMTQANVAELLGVRRASASVALEALERDGAVALRRSCITVVDPKRLNAAACTCHQVVAELYPSIFAHG